MENYDFAGWASKANIKCSDGRTILRDAFKHNDGQTVPLVWNHSHNNPFDVLGHALLENREDGMYAYCKFNDSESGQTARLLVQHGDVNALSIYANQLKENMNTVLHGNIREVSLVLAGANPGASIDTVMLHGEECADEAIIYTGLPLDGGGVIEHAEEKKEAEPEKKEESKSDDKTIAEVLKTLTPEQEIAMYALIGELVDGDDDSDDENEEEETKVKHNVFEQEDTTMDKVLSHSEMKAVIDDVKRYGSLKESAIQHGIEQIDYLFPEAHNLNTPPEFIQRNMGWVPKVMNGVHKSPFSRIKSMFADITADEARAKGYLKGNLKKDEVFGLLKRTTTPTTVYKKQKLDRDDIVDIVDFDVLAWIKGEMRMMLDEELARAVLIGDGRNAASDDKINEQNIRPIWTDEELFTIKALVEPGANATDSDKAKAFIKAVIKSRKNYKGSGEPTLYTTEDMLTDCLLIEDMNGRIIYDSITKLASTLRVKEIVTVPVMEGAQRTANGKTLDLMGLIVNLKDYNMGADKGGAVNMFDDFDLDYNAQRYLIETRCSGALTKPFSAIALEIEHTAG